VNLFDLLYTHNISKGLDPHQDTPVEILHVVLLGFVKYFWRDAISRMNDAQKSILITRLSSLDVTGLGIPPLAGQTLVKYAGSLTGRDFRAIAQSAPFVLYDLVPRECYDTWLSLCSLVPLIWQPMITNLDEHLVSRVIYKCRPSAMLLISVPRSGHYSHPSIIFSIALLGGHHAGLTSRNFTSSDTLLITYADLVPQYYLQLKASSRSMQSFGLKVYTATIMHPQEILAVASLVLTVFVIFSAEVDLSLEKNFQTASVAHHHLSVIAKRIGAQPAVSR
jgi:hypothetical protein